MGRMGGWEDEEFATVVVMRREVRIRTRRERGRTIRGRVGVSYAITLATYEISVPDRRVP